VVEILISILTLMAIVNARTPPTSGKAKIKIACPNGRGVPRQGPGDCPAVVGDQED
jgi:hypothetical protein